jgi:hypothetical protein
MGMPSGTIRPKSLAWLDRNSHVFRSHELCGDWANTWCNLNRKKVISVTPLRLVVKSLILELNDSVLALVFLVFKTESPVLFRILSGLY